RKYLERGSIRRNLKVTPGLIYNVSSGYRGGLQIKYSFTYNGKEYKGDTKKLISSSVADKFKDKKLPVVFDSINAVKNEMLVLPDDFEKFNLPFPDTLNWTMILKNKSL
ncbi:hypothetical protein, partial [Adhaeribacter aerolatus]|uniref:hypothetical protein n=1 Tax=Adhaeribacter aerolatus TaxID=670289 RepID=UPI0014786355